MRGGKYPCAGAVIFGCNMELEHRVDYTIFGMRKSITPHHASPSTDSGQG
jgi:hypothetical protein